MANRPYRQTLRAESAEQTRRRILDALAELIREDPARPVAIDAVAARAGVARSTIYTVFDSRAGLFDALTFDLIERSGYHELLEAVQDPDVLVTLRDGFRATFAMYAPDRDLSRALYSMAELDADAIGGAIAVREKQRAAGMARLARRFAKAGLLRSDVTVKQAENLLWVLTSFDTFDLLYRDRGLDVDEIAELLTATAKRSLLVADAG